MYVFYLLNGIKKNTRIISKYLFQPSLQFINRGFSRANYYVFEVENNYPLCLF